MTKKGASERIELLRKELEKHRILYHVHDSPIISYEVYDSLMKELVSLEEQFPEFDSPYSPSKRVGGTVLSSFSKVDHSVRQWSFDNVFSFEELTSWEERNSTLLRKEGISALPSYVAELKIDGLKIVLTYEDGYLVRGATRGDGTQGEDITENIKTFKSIPLILPEKKSCSVIGEAWMHHDDLKTINKEREKEGLPLYANTRNLAAGTLRQLDSRIVAKRNLQLFAYDIEEGGYATQEEELATLIRWGFLVNPHHAVCRTLQEVQSFYDVWSEKRTTMAYGIDGLVIKVNERKLFDILGYTAKSPRGGIAYKFKAEEATTRLHSVTFQVGRTGAVTPVAELEPVVIAGSTVRRATLHNEDEMKRLGICEGDTVMVRKAGDVIPEIFDVVRSLRPPHAVTCQMTSVCPSCQSVLIKEESGTSLSSAWYCKNKECEAQHIETIIHFTSKKGLDIEGLGVSTIETFHELGLITNIPSLFSLTREDIASLSGFGDKSADNIIDAINKARHVSLHRFIYALGIRHVGETTAKDIARHFGTVSSFMNATDEELSRVFGVGEKVSSSIISYLHDRQHQETLHTLKNILTIEEEKGISSGKLAGISFVITGTLPTMSRDEAKAFIESHGGKVGESVSKKTTYLLLGEGGGSKRDKAQELGITMIQEKELQAMVY